jgi:hypothetical protein
MKLLFDSFWRAGAYCLHPKVIGLSLLPLLIGVALALGLGWFYWEAAVAAVRSSLENWLLIDAALKWVESLVGGSFRAVIAPLIVVALAAPVIVVLSVLLVAWLMTPAIVGLVAARRFPALERKRGAGLLTSIGWSLVCTLAALLALVLTVPLWFIPPLVLVVPPLIWGWLNYRVLSFDVLAEHASADERRQIMQQQRMPLLGIGVVSGFLGAAPSLIWAASALTLVFAPLLVVVSVWLNTLVFGFSALWFTHFALAALAQLRGQAALVDREPAPFGGGSVRGGGEVIDLPVTTVTNAPPSAAAAGAPQPPAALPPPAA